VRELRKNYDNRSIVLSFALWGMLLPIVSMVLGEMGILTSLDFMISGFAWPWREQWWALLAVGVFALIGQILITKAYREEKAGLVSAIGYVNIPFSILIGYWLGDPFPDLLTYLGIALIIAGGAIISLRRNV
jgi:drug/metabolite transporter (DMT)-like permease